MRYKQYGFTLIKLVVGLFISLGVVLAGATLYVLYHFLAKVW